MSAAPFFEAGRTYLRGRWFFQSLAVAPNPFNGEVRAVGWLYRSGEPATATALDPDDWERGGWAAASAEKATAPAATATPAGPLGAGARGRLDLLRHAVTDYQGEWTTGRVEALYRARHDNADWRATARRDLAQLHREGLLVEHTDEPTRHHYTFNARNGGRT